MKLTRTVGTWIFALALSVSAAPSSFAGLSLSITVAPPALPVYEQPVCPGEGYIWTPGYWAWGDDDYYWVPGTWMLAPEPGFLWTPGYWGWSAGAYSFHEGHWGVTVGFYGGINYGFGYAGSGYAGGRWDNGHFFYNRSVTNVNTTVVKNVYNTTVVNNNTTINRVSYNGGNGGVEARATNEEMAAERERHVDALPEQRRHAEAARGNPQLRASANQGRPPIAATQRPNEFKGHAVVAAREAGGPYHPASRAEGAGAAATRPGHVKDIPSSPHTAPPSTGDPALDQRHQQQQQRLSARQDQERQKLQTRQESDHQRLTQRQGGDAQRQKMEQGHERQTQHLMQRHAQQQQKLDAKHQKPRSH